MAYKLFPIGTIPYILGGQAASGYKVYSYVTGTTTPKVTYTDSTGATPNTNPVVFDQYGLKQMWLDTTTNYKLIVKSSDDATTYITLDDVEGMGGATSGANVVISSLRDSANIPYIAFSSAPTAVNYLTLSNAATGESPTWTATGSDTNVGANYVAKGSGNHAFTGTMSVSGALTSAGSVNSQSAAFSGVVTPAQITSDQNNYAPTGSSTVYCIRISSDAARNITGLGNGVAGRQVVLLNVGSFNITLKNENASSDAANRFALGGGDYTLQSGDSIILYYSPTDTRWCGRRGAPTVTTQAAMEVSSDNSTFVSPGTLGYSPYVAKAWCKFTTITSGAIISSWLVSSVTDGGVGLIGVNLSVAFSSANYNVTGICYQGGTGLIPYILSSSTTTAVNVGLLDVAGAQQEGVGSIAVFGDW